MARDTFHVSASTVQETSAFAASGVAQGLMQIGGSLFNAFAAQRAHEGSMWVQTQRVDAAIATDQWNQDFVKDAPLGAEGMPQAHQEFFKKYREDALAAAPTQAARDQLSSELEAVRARSTAQMGAMYTQQRVALGVKNYSDLSDKTAVTVALGQLSLEDGLDALNKAGASILAGLPASDREAVTTKQRQELAVNTVHARLAQAKSPGQVQAVTNDLKTNLVYQNALGDKLPHFLGAAAQSMDAAVNHAEVEQHKAWQQATTGALNEARNLNTALESGAMPQAQYDLSMAGVTARVNSLPPGAVRDKLSYDAYVHGNERVRQVAADKALRRSEVEAAKQTRMEVGQYQEAIGHVPDAATASQMETELPEVGAAWPAEQRAAVGKLLRRKIADLEKHPLSSGEKAAQAKAKLELNSAASDAKLAFSKSGDTLTYQAAMEGLVARASKEAPAVYATMNNQLGAVLAASRHTAERDQANAANADQKGVVFSALTGMSDLARTMHNSPTEDVTAQLEQYRNLAKQTQSALILRHVSGLENLQQTLQSQGMTAENKAAYTEIMRERLTAEYQFSIGVITATKLMATRDELVQRAQANPGISSLAAAVRLGGLNNGKAMRDEAFITSVASALVSSNSRAGDGAAMTAKQLELAGAAVTQSDQRVQFTQVFQRVFPQVVAEIRSGVTGITQDIKGQYSMDAKLAEFNAHDIVPRAVDKDFGSAEADTLRAMVAARRMGIPPAAVLKMYTGEAAVDAAKAKELYGEEVKRHSGRNDLAQESDHEVRSAYARAFQAALRSGANTDVARGMAEKDTEKRSGKSDFSPYGGRVMHPPETTYNMDADAIRAQAYNTYATNPLVQHGVVVAFKYNSDTPVAELLKSMDVKMTPTAMANGRIAYRVYFEKNGVVVPAPGLFVPHPTGVSK